MDLDLTAEQTDALEVFVREVEASPHNLVSRRARTELRSRHVPECVGLAKLLPPDARLLDVGSGGGFPGLVIAITRPDLDVTLLDSTEKKASFLQATADKLEVRVQVVNDRAEEAQRGPMASSFDVCTARAVAPLGRLIGWTIPFVRPGGLVYAVKGDRWAEELVEASDEIKQWGVQVAATPADLSTATDPNAPLVVILRRLPR